MSEQPPQGIRIDVSFVASAQGAIPLDHGYPLSAALSRHNPRLHEALWLAIQPLSGRVFGNSIHLRPHTSALRLRLPPEKIPEVVTLAGKTLEVAGTRILLGVSQLYMLKPAAVLTSRMVTIKGYMEPEAFEAKIKQDLETRGIQATVEVGRRRIVIVAKDKVVGFSLRLSGLSDEHSLEIQYAGLGGRQRFGCGIFGPATRDRRQP